MSLKTLLRAGGVAATWLAGAVLAFSLVTPAQAQTKFSREQLEQMMAPIALYPDALLAQTLMAATYPAEVKEASEWADANKDRYKGDDAVKQVEGRNWDPSVKSLVAFPSVLATMRENADWTQNVGDAFLTQRAELMNAVQALRVQADKAGNLKSSNEVKVVKEQQTIIIEPADPQVIYVPQYNPTVVYGAWAYLRIRLTTCTHRRATTSGLRWRPESPGASRSAWATRSGAAATGAAAT